MKAAYEGGHRLSRRDKNIMTAFTYGKKLRYSQLDDPQYKEKILYENRSKKQPTKQWLEKKIQEEKSQIDLNLKSKFVS